MPARNNTQNRKDVSASRARSKAGVKPDPKRDPRRNKTVASDGQQIAEWVVKWLEKNPDGPQDKEDAQLLSAMTDAAVRLGALIPVHEVKAAAAKKAAALKTSLDAMPARFKAACPSADEDAMAALRDCLAEVAEEMMQ